MDKTNELLGRIIIDPKVMVGQPVVKGTRITVQNILSLLIQGISDKEILMNYPNLKQDDIYACIAFAAKVMEDATFVPLRY